MAKEWASSDLLLVPQDQPKWMAKYTAHDLKNSKGDLEGLSPYLVAQIQSVAVSKSGSRGARLIQPRRSYGHRLLSARSCFVLGRLSRMTVGRLRAHCLGSHADSTHIDSMQMCRHQHHIQLQGQSLRAARGRLSRAGIQDGPLDRLRH